MDAMRTSDEWHSLGQAIYRDVVGTLARYGVRPHPELRFIRGTAQTPFYEPASNTIEFGVPDAALPAGRLYYYLVQHLVGASDLTETQHWMDVPLPWSVTHELMHHLRHHFGAPITNDFVEEQVVNCIAIALLQEHPRYRAGLVPLKEWANRIFERTRGQVPEAEPFLRGFRLEAGDVLVSQGVITPSILRDARRLAELTGSTTDDILKRTGQVTGEQMTQARTERDAAEAYFNRRYMTGLREYWLFGTEWLTRYLERDDLPTLADALERYILTEDWEASQRDATRLLLEQALGSTDAVIACAAAEALPEIAGVDAIAPLVSVLDDPRPAVQAAALEALGRVPKGPVAGITKAIAILERNDEASRQAARLLRQGRFPIGDAFGDAPVIRAGTACARLPDDPAAYAELDALLAGDESSVLAALDVLGEAGPGPLVERILPYLHDSRLEIRAAAVRALRQDATTLPALIDLIVDDDPPVRQAAREVVAGLDRSSWPALTRALSTRPEAVTLEALRLVDLDAIPEARDRLDTLGRSVMEHARQVEQLGAMSAARAELDVLSQAASEERRRLARLSLRALGRLVDPGMVELAEPALDSPVQEHWAGGLDLVRGSLGDDGIELARLLSPALASTQPTDVHETLAAFADANADILRLLTAYLASELLDMHHAQTLLARLAADAEPLVREEANAALQRLHTSVEPMMLTTVEKLMFLRSVATFAECPVDTLRRVAQRCVTQQFDTGETILREGEPGQHFYIVTDGRIAISVGGHQIDELGPRHYFGEMALFDGGRRSATATALSPTTLLRLDRDDFYRLGREFPDLFIGVIRVLSERLRTHMARINGQPEKQDATIQAGSSGGTSVADQ